MGQLGSRRASLSCVYACCKGVIDRVRGFGMLCKCTGKLIVSGKFVRIGDEDLIELVSSK